jgi:hypothetical protein
MLDINTTFGREVLPASMIIKDMNIQGKAEIMKYLQGQEEQMQETQKAQMEVQHAFEHAKLQELMSKAASNIARAREDHSRSESNLGLYEERLSMIERNKAMTLKEKQAALKSLLESIQLFGQVETEYAENKLQIEASEIDIDTEREKQDVHRRTESNKFLEQILGAGMGALTEPNQQQPQQSQQSQSPEMASQMT